MSDSTESAVVLQPPFTGPCLVQNSPANRVPSHGTERFATAYSIDLVPVDQTGRTAPVTLRTILRPEPLERFPGFETSRGVRRPDPLEGCRSWHVHRSTTRSSGSVRFGW